MQSEFAKVFWKAYFWPIKIKFLPERYNITSSYWRHCVENLLGNLATLLLGLLGALLGGDVTADLGVVNLLAHLAGHGVADLGVDSVALLLIGGKALLAGNILKQV